MMHKTIESKYNTLISQYYFSLGAFYVHECIIFAVSFPVIHFATYGLFSQFKFPDAKPVCIEDMRGIGPVLMGELQGASPPHKVRAMWCVCVDWGGGACVNSNSIRRHF